MIKRPYFVKVVDVLSGINMAMTSVSQCVNHIAAAKTIAWMPSKDASVRMDLSVALINVFATDLVETVIQIDVIAAV